MYIYGIYGLSKGSFIFETNYASDKELSKLLVRKKAWDMGMKCPLRIWPRHVNLSPIKNVGPSDVKRLEMWTCVRFTVLHSHAIASIHHSLSKNAIPKYFSSKTYIYILYYIIFIYFNVRSTNNVGPKNFSTDYDTCQ